MINLEQEIWKDIKGYEGLYQINNRGDIISLKNRWGLRDIPRPVSQHKTPKGYMRCGLNKNGLQKLHMVHVLVYTAFYEKIPIGYEINHKDYNRSNNNISNLEIMTHKNNIRYSKCVSINQYDLNGNFIRDWMSLRDVEREIGIDHRQISDCINGKQKTCHGYIWKRKENINE